MDQDTNQSNRAFSKSDWIEDQRFEFLIEDPNSEVVLDVPAVACASVNYAEAPNGRRKYSFCLGFRRTDEERPRQFFPIIARGQGKVVILSAQKAIEEVTKAALAYMTEKLQEQEDARIDYKQSKEVKKPGLFVPPQGQVARHPATVRVGKTERDKNKHKNQNDALGVLSSLSCEGPIQRGLAFIRLSIALYVAFLHLGPVKL